MTQKSIICIMVMIIIVLIVCLLIGVRVGVALGTSMEPTMQTGSVFLIAPAAEYKVGDIIVFPEQGMNIVHRITAPVDSTGDGSSDGYYVKGDSNQDEDPWIVCHEKIRGRIIKIFW